MQRVGETCLSRLSPAAECERDEFSEIVLAAFQLCRRLPERDRVRLAAAAGSSLADRLVALVAKLALVRERQP
jgi:hypothetical protein